MTAFQAFANQYSAHTDVTINLATGTALISIAHHPDNHGPYNCRLYELPAPYTGAPVLKREWRQGQPGQLGPFGYGASVVLPTGALLVVTPLGIESGANVAPTYLIEPGYAKPYTLGGSDPDLIAAVNQLQAIVRDQQIEIDKLKAAQGGLSAEDRAILDWLPTMPR